MPKSEDLVMLAMLGVAVLLGAIGLEDRSTGQGSGVEVTDNGSDDPGAASGS